MADLKNHSFTSNSKIRKFSLTLLIFMLPVLGVLALVEYELRHIEYPEAVKNRYIQNHKNKIEILFLGSSQIERAINPEYLSKPAINLANSSQRLPEDFLLLKHFAPQLPSLQVVVIEVGYDKLYRDKNYTSKIIDQKNLLFYGINTFNRIRKLKEHFLFFSDPRYFSNLLKEKYNHSSPVQLNKYGFDENQFFGSYQAVKYRDSLILDKDIFIENVKTSKKVYSHNLKVLYKIIEYCKTNNLNILIYSSPKHFRYNELRNQNLVEKRDSLFSVLKTEYPQIKFFIKDKDSSFTANYFYNGNHLNPDGAKKATKDIDNEILKDFF